MDRAIEIIKGISTEEYTTSAELADRLQVSSRTIRNDILLLNQELEKNGAYIESKPRRGMILCITDGEKYDQYYHNLMRTSSMDRLSRIYQVTEYLLSMESSITMDELCDIFFVSRSTLKSDMREVRKILKKHEIELDYRANQGIKIIGSERKLRNCLADIQKDRFDQNPLEDETIWQIMEIISKKVNQYHFDISDYSIRNLALHISVAILRIGEGKELEPDQELEKKMISSSDMDLLLSIIDEVEALFSVSFSKGEITYLYLQLIGKKTFRSNHANGNLVVSEKTYKLVTEMLEHVNEVFKIDFRYDLELVTTLAMHLVPLEIRAKHDIAVHNSMADDIRHHVLLSYNMAIIACDTLEKRLGKKLPMDEVAFIALPFSLALKRKWSKQKEKILIVCGSGKASSELLAYQVREYFGNYLEVVATTDCHNLEFCDFSEVDYILTTVPIQESIPVPIIETSTFFDGREITQVNKSIKDNKTNRFLDYFKKDMVFWSDSADKKVILQEMCRTAVDKYDIPEDFYDYVIQREEIGRTSFGNLISIAHPIHPVGQESFVALTVLKSAIDWDGEPAQLIFLLSMKKDGDSKMKTFYKVMAKLVNNKQFIQMLLRSTSYDEVISILRLVADSEYHTVL